MTDTADQKDHNTSEDKYLWEDPLLKDGRFKDRTGPVLLAEEICEYVRKYHLLIADPKDFDEKHLKGASYSMRPDPRGNAWRFNENGDKEYLRKKKGKDDKGNDIDYYEVPENSLVYIRLLEKLRLPYYLIGRFNLKVTYTYKGLLLGTGPQVDPGYEANLNIPLHNFTKDPVKIVINDSFVSIDFVRTSQPQLPKELPKSRLEFLKDDKFRELRDKLRPQDPDKLKRNEIEDYVGDSRPTSSLAKLVSDLTEDKKKFASALSKIKFDFIAVAVLVVTMLGLTAMGFY